MEHDTNIEEMGDTDEEQGSDDIRVVKHNIVNKSSKKVTILTNDDIERKLAARYVYLSNDVMARRASIVPDEERKKLSFQGSNLQEFRRKSSLNPDAINKLREKLQLEDQDVSNEEEFMMNAFSDDPVMKKGKAPESYVGFNKNPFRRGSVDPRKPSGFGLGPRRPSLYPSSNRNMNSNHELNPITEEEPIEEGLFENDGTTEL